MCQGSFSRKDVPPLIFGVYLPFEGFFHTLCIHLLEQQKKGDSQNFLEEAFDTVLKERTNFLGKKNEKVLGSGASWVIPQRVAYSLPRLTSYHCTRPKHVFFLLNASRALPVTWCLGGIGFIFDLD